MESVLPLICLVSSTGVIGTKIAHNDSWRPTEILYQSEWQRAGLMKL